MIESRRSEGARVMTNTAVLIGRDMTGFLRRGKTSIVAGAAVVHYARVTEGCGLKTGGLVAVDAIAVSWHMEIGLSGCGRTIVAADTVIHDSLVLEGGSGKVGGVMAHRAVLACILMNRIIR